MIQMKSVGQLLENSLLFREVGLLFYSSLQLVGWGSPTISRHPVVQPGWHIKSTVTPKTKECSCRLTERRTPARHTAAIKPWVHTFFPERKSSASTTCCLLSGLMWCPPCRPSPVRADTSDYDWLRCSGHCPWCPLLTLILSFTLLFCLSLGP